MAVVILSERNLAGIHELPVFDRYSGGVSGYRQRCRHDQRQHKGCHVFEYFQMTSSFSKDKTSLFPERSCVLFFSACIENVDEQAYTVLHEADVTANTCIGQRVHARLHHELAEGIVHHVTRLALQCLL